MSETSTNALFINDELKFIREDDGSIIFLRTTPPIRPCLAAQLEALPEPSAEYMTMTRLMALIKVRKPTKGENECKTTKSTTSLGQQSSTSSQPEAMITKT